MSDLPVIVVGAGLAGLCCTRELQAAGVQTLLLESADNVGGRVRTDHVDGFLLDRGFQVLQTAYPEARRVLDYAALDLKPFEPGAIIRVGNGWSRMTDPWRRPWQTIVTALNGIVEFSDFWKLVKLRHDALAGTLEELWSQPDSTTADFLRKQIGLSDGVYEKFFRPWFAGVFFDPELATSSRFFRFVFRMFATGDSSLPATGMQAIPRQLAAGISPDAIRLSTPVERIAAGRVHLVGGATLSARAIVLAVAGPEAARLSGGAISVPASCATWCCYFAAPQAPVKESLLILNGTNVGPINNLCVPSNVAPGYAPGGQALISVSVVGSPGDGSAGGDSSDATAAVLRQLREWYGAAVDTWRHLRTYEIRHALPAQPSGFRDAGMPGARIADGLYACGDYRESASIHGAMLSGRRAAEAVIDDLRVSVR